MKRAALYLRVSTGEQTTENQRMKLEEVAKRAGWEVADIYEDAGISGAKGRDKRPELDRLLKDATRRRFDIVMAWSVDRLGRSLQDLVSLLSELHAVGVDLYLDQQGVDTTTPAGKAMFQMMGVFAEFEREIISERIKAGLARAKAQGKRLGQKPISKAKEVEILQIRSEGNGIKKTAKLAGVGVGTVQRVVQASNPDLALPKTRRRPGEPGEVANMPSMSP